jgi:small-conductance mechanosensitive channel
MTAFLPGLASPLIRLLLWLGGLVVGTLAVRLAILLLGKSRHGFSQAAVRRLGLPLTCLVPVGVARLSQVLLPIGPTVRGLVDHGLLLLLIALTGWGLVSLFDAWRDFAMQSHPINTADNLRARQLHTQLQIIRRTFVILVVLITAAAMLMTFPAVRVLGATLFASAGAAGLIVGLSARPLISNLIAGIQIALTEPIRLDDVVIVEGEWGWIEEIRATYVVVRIWDLRRLIVPLSYFIAQPFQNWTRNQTDLLGHLYLYADYTLPVQALRDEFLRRLGETPLWDGKAAGLQVTEATPQGVQLRALMSARNSSDSWNLRCLIREQLIAFLQSRYPQCLPHTRIDWMPSLSQPPPPAPG